MGPVQTTEGQVVRIYAQGDGDAAKRRSFLVDPRSGERFEEQEAQPNEISFKRAVAATNEWALHAGALDMQAAETAQCSVSSADPLRPETPLPRTIPATMASRPDVAVVADRLPGKTVRWFTLGAALIWMLAAIFHVVDVLLFRDSAPETLERQRLQVTWPRPARLFEMGSLHCNSSSVLVSSRCAVFGAPRATAAVGEFVEVAAFPAAAVLCDASGCDALRKSLTGVTGQWQLVSLMGNLSSARPPSELSLPTTWRTVAATWASCKLPPCNSPRLLIAGWDGTEVLVAEAWHVTPSGAWELQPLSAATASKWRCAAGGCAAALSAGETYVNVRAMHLEAGTGRLAVLL